MCESPMSMSGLVCGLELAINVRDKETARLWYADKLGIVFDKNDRAYISGVTLVLWGFDNASPASHVVYQFVTPNLEQAHAKLGQRGVPVSDIDAHNWNFLANDPDGNKFVFYTPQQWLASGMVARNLP
jgi:hypothetical protein